MRFFFLLLSIIFLNPLFSRECQVHTFETQSLMGKACARKIVDLIKKRNAENKTTVLGLATGSTPIPLYESFRKIVKEENVDLSKVITFNLDEYCSVPPDHEASYRYFMYENLFSDLDIPQENIHLLNGYAETEQSLSQEELIAFNKAFPKRKKINLTDTEKKWIFDYRAKEYEKLIEKLGPIDIQILGIGTNGHIGFCEPGSSFSGKTSLVKLTENTRKDNSRFFPSINQVPKYAITMGLDTIMKAKEIYLLANGEHKASIIRNFLRSEVSTMIPATILKKHPHLSVYLDKQAMQELVVCFRGGHLVRNHCLQPADLWISGGKVIAPQDKADVVIDVENTIIAPGYIDLQINGAFGIDVCTNPERISEMVDQLPQFGVTALLPSIVTSSSEDYRRVLPILRNHMNSQSSGSHVLGLHLEGPFFACEKCGAQNSSLIRSCNHENVLEEVYGSLDGVKMVTLAPELEGALDVIKKLKEKGIIVSAAHSVATEEEMHEAIRHGLGFITHLFNAMPSFHHRDPGIIGTALTHPDLSFSIIADPHHLHPKTIQLAWQMAPHKLILISDAIAALGLPSGSYQLASLNVEVQDNKAVIQGTDTLAGSVTGLDEAVRYLYNSSNCSKADAIESASYKPAKLLNIEKTKGHLEVGADADIVILDHDLYVKATFIKGVCSFLDTKALSLIPKIVHSIK